MEISTRLLMLQNIANGALTRTNVPHKMHRYINVHVRLTNLVESVGIAMNYFYHTSAVKYFNCNTLIKMSHYFNVSLLKYYSMSLLRIRD